MIQCYECVREHEDTAALVGIVDRPERFCDIDCALHFVERLGLPIVLGIGTWFIDQAGEWPETQPEPSPLIDAVLRATESDATIEEAGVDPLPSPHPIARVEIVPLPTPLYSGDGYPRLAGRKA